MKENYLHAKISIVLPVFNAENFVRNAVESALNLPEVKEIILIEDNSPDNSLQKCQEIVREFEKVKLFRHPDGQNKGAGASRNLGITESSGEFIAFLDADDWYLPNRFEAEREILQDPEIDGVYGATGFFLEKENILNQNLTTFKTKVTADQLLFKLLNMEGKFHTTGITIRKSILKKTGLFDTTLKLHQDTHLWYRLAFHGNIVAGIIDKPISIRRVHSGNRITNKSTITRGIFHKAVFRDFKTYSNVDNESMKIIINRYINAISPSTSVKLLNYIKVLSSSPRHIFTYL